MDPYAPPPGHNTNPTHPVTLNGKTLCACDDCREARQRWADKQEPLVTALPEGDNADDLYTDNGGSD